MHNLLKALAVIVLSGLAYYFSSGFGAIWALMWLAPIPVLIYAYSQSYAKVSLVAFIVGLAPGINTIIGYWLTGIPVQSFIIAALIQSIQWTVVILLSSVLVKRIKTPCSLLAYPALLSLLEWLVSLGPQGTFNTIAYSQLHFLAAMQIASLAGFFGVSFILSLFASSLAYTVVFHKTESKSWLALILSLAVVASCLAYGFYRTQAYNEPSTSVKVGLASLDRSPKVVYNPAMAESILQAYRPMIQSLAQQGAKIVLLPEESLSVTPADSAQIKAQLSQIAQQNQITLIIGINDLQKDHRYNSAWLFSPQGKLIGAYDKRHFVPVVEDGITPGVSLLSFPINNAKAGIAICRDLDYPYPAHHYGQDSTNILFAPAWDFEVDAQVHTAGAFTRGIENGYTVVRAARAGYLSITSPTGKVIAESLVAKGNNMLIADAPIWQNSSFYAQHGYWFVWVLILILALLFGMLIKSRKLESKLN
ncbi:MAG: hypothetical protein K0S29_1015 [Gammaproteobacteria bacterium]|jgi:apolipoprotein N-acyltransferase|nr:hypothetical protein [Gammaproteobacteria bacterium]